MIGQLLAKVIGTQNDRELKRLRPRVAAVNEFESRVSALSDDELRAHAEKLVKSGYGAYLLGLLERGS